MKIAGWSSVILVAALILGFTAWGEAADLVKLQGAGASFPAPLYFKWFKAYSGSHKNVQIDYQSVGSGSGVKSFMDKTVDFGASDAAMTPEEMSQVAAGVQCLPVTAGSIVLAYNIAGVTELKLSRKVYADIFLGKVKKWNDPLIANANPGIKLPDAPINVVVRADSSGTTYVFTKHLSAISPDFTKSPGTNKMPNWPVGTRSKGNEGVTAYITATPASGQAALASAKIPNDLIAWVSDPDAKDAYPIVTYTWLLLYRNYPDKKKTAVLQDLLKYVLTDGQKDAEPLGYIPLPKPVGEKVLAALKNIK